MRNTRKTFVSMDDTVRRMRRTDPIQFAVLYNEWRLMREQAEDRRRSQRSPLMSR